MFEMFQYDFIIKALIAGILLCLSASLVGPVVVLKKNSLIGDGLSHVAFGAISVATVMHIAPIEFAIPVTIIASILIMLYNSKFKGGGDTLIGIISTSALAFGIFFISINNGVHVDLNNYLFGSILSLETKDIIITVIVTILIVVVFLIFYKRIYTITYDEDFAKASGIHTLFYNILYAVMSSFVIVIGMRLMGALLISSLLIFPTISARNVCKSFKNVVIVGIIISIINYFIGLVLSYHLSSPTGATVVIINLIVLIILKIYSLIAYRRKRKVTIK